MTRLAILCFALAGPSTTPAQDQDAKRLAQDILNQGSALFDTKDAAAMAATYVEDAELSLIGKDQGSGTYKTQVTRGRDAIEKFYQNIFKDRQDGAKSRNVVEYAHFVGSDLLIVHGTFAPDADRGGAIPFVQVRARRGEKWLMMSLQLFLVSEP